MQRHPVAGLEGDKQQRHKVVYNGLHDIADKTGIHGLLVGLFHLFLLDRQRTAVEIGCIIAWQNICRKWALTIAHAFFYNSKK